MGKPDKNFSSLQLSKNIISNYVVFIAGILISFWYTPYLVRNLGKELFGFIPLASSVTNLLGIITLSFHQSNRRHVMVEIEKGNLTQANKIYTASFFGTLLLIAVAAPIAVLLVLFSPGLFSAPPEHRLDIILIFLGTVIAFLLTTLEITFSIAAFTRNRFDLENLFSLLARIGQVALIVLLFTLDRGKLVYVAGGLILTALITISGDIFLWKKLLPGLKISWRSFEKQYLRLLMGTSIWMFIYQVGTIFFINLDMLIANRVLGLSLAGIYGALLVIPKNLRIMSNAVGGVWGPTIFSRFGRADHQGMDRVVRTSSKIIGLTLALPVGFLAGSAQPFLNLWLGPEFTPMVWVLIVMVFHLSFNLITSPFFNVQLSHNRVIAPALVSILSGIAYGLLAFLLAQRIGPLGIVIASALMLSVKNLLFMPVYTARIMGLAWWRYLGGMLRIILWTLGVALVSYVLDRFLPVASYFSLLLNGSLVSLGYLVAVLWIGLTKEEKELGRRMLRGLGEEAIGEAPESS